MATPIKLTLPQHSAIKLQDSFHPPLEGGASSFKTKINTDNPFTDFLSSLAKSTRDHLKKGEAISQKASIESVDPQEVATTVVEAKAALQQFTALLNAATGAYQELIRTAL